MRGFCAEFEDCRALKTVEAFSPDRKELRCWVGCVVMVESASLRDGIARRTYRDPEYPNCRAVFENKLPSDMLYSHRKCNPTPYLISDIPRIST